ncbi:MAG: bifunctional diguanylate cyclase/phosphodiesterase, partial [Spongiibacteraceae bacterium]|nr:bifunctional diguanylate cyclase/phosphodiesterase [Spongiibacteraceae bacterium]
VLINIRRFREINHSYGHRAGDAMLKEIARRLVAWKSEDAKVARLGGANFGLILPDAAGVRGVSQQIEALLRELRQPLLVENGIELMVDATAGIALCPEHGRNVGDLLRFADSAVAAARSEGSHGYRFYEAGFTDAVHTRLSHEARLRRAIDNGDIDVHFQPQVDVRSGVVIGAEALARWHDAELGPVAPDRFIGLAEESGLILPLGEVVLAKACRLWSELIVPFCGPLSLAVNVSAAHFAHPALTGLVTQILSAAGLAADRLELEITETAVMSQQETALATMHRLREAGIQLALDDFGTGHSSLAYLRHFPLDKLKIDRQFVRHVPENPDDRAIVRAIVQLGHALGFTVLAEGVERTEQLAFLAAEQCDAYQGWLFAKAMTAQELQQLLLETRNALVQHVAFGQSTGEPLRS